MTLMLLVGAALGCKSQNLQKGEYYLYCHMNGGVAWTAYAVSEDGVHFKDIRQGDSIFSDYKVARIEGR